MEVAQRPKPRLMKDLQGPLLVDGSNKQYWIVQVSGGQKALPTKGGGPAVWIETLGVLAGYGPYEVTPFATVWFRYYSARYYETSTGRFIRFRGGINKYAYANDNPRT